MADNATFKYSYAGSITEWKRSDEYHNSFLIKPDAVLDSVRKNAADKGLPDEAVSTAQGKLLQLLVKSLGAKRVLEVGCLGGYSAIMFARGIPEDGEVISLELSEHHAQVARENIQTAGFADKVKVITGPAIDSIKALEPSFDLAFIDADKASNALYYAEARRLVRKGGVIIVDNVVWGGTPAFPENSDPKIEGIRSLLAAVRDDPDVEATTISTVGERGYDGFLYAVVN